MNTLPDDRKQTNHALCPKCNQIDRIAESCDQLNRTLRGHNGEVGLITQVALLVEQSRRIGSDLEKHICEHQEDRAKQKTFQMQILERVILWLLVAVLSLALAGGKLENLKNVATMVQDSSGAAR